MASVSKRDYYDILGVDRNASDDDLKKAYRKLARQHHPDLQTGDQQKKAAEEKFKEINEAYETLSDQDKRKRYDMFGHAGAQQGTGGFDGFDFGRGGLEMSLTTFLKTFSAKLEAVVAAEPNVGTTSSTISKSHLKKPSTGKKPNSRFRGGKSAWIVRAPEPSQPRPSRPAQAAKAPGNFDFNRGSSVSADHADNAKGPVVS